MKEKIGKLNGFKVLFVEDEITLRSIIEKTMTKLGIDFETAENGLVALEKIKQNNYYKVVFSDINMPLMNGLELLEKTKKFNSSIPFVLMSAHTEAEFIETANKFGVYKYLTKPISFIDVINTMVEIKENN